MEKSQTGQIEQKKEALKPSNLVLFVGTTGLNEFNEIGNQFETAIISAYSRVHSQLTGQEIITRMMEAKQYEIQVNPEITQFTFIYSGHGTKFGLSVGDYILQYQTLLGYIFNFDEKSKNQLSEIRIVLDCCHAGGMADNIANYLIKFFIPLNIQKVKIICASNTDGKTVAFGRDALYQSSPFFEYFFLGAKDFNKTYTVDHQGQGIYIFNYGNMNTGIISQSIASYQTFQKNKKGEWVVIDNSSQSFNFH